MCNTSRKNEINAKCWVCPVEVTLRLNAGLEVFLVLLPFGQKKNCWSQKLWRLELKSQPRLNLSLAYKCIKNASKDSQRLREACRDKNAELFVTGVNQSVSAAEWQDSTDTLQSIPKDTNMLPIPLYLMVPLSLTYSAWGTQETIHSDLQRDRHPAFSGALSSSAWIITHSGQQTYFSEKP